MGDASDGSGELLGSCQTIKPGMSGWPSLLSRRGNDGGAYLQSRFPTEQFELQASRG